MYQERLPWMLESNYIDRPTWKKLNRPAELKSALGGLDEPTKAAILHVRNDIEALIRKKLK